jgi:hypothetical protein
MYGFNFPEAINNKKRKPAQKYCVSFSSVLAIDYFPLTGEKEILSGHAKIKDIFCPSKFLQ